MIIWCKIQVIINPIYLLDIRMEKICGLILGVHLGPQGHDGGQMFPLVTNNHHVGDDLLHLSLDTKNVYFGGNIGLFITLVPKVL